MVSIVRSSVTHSGEFAILKRAEPHKCLAVVHVRSAPDATCRKTFRVEGWVEHSRRFPIVCDIAAVGCMFSD